MKAPARLVRRLALPVLLIAGIFGGGAHADSRSPFIDAVRTDLEEDSQGAPPTAPGAFLKGEQAKLRSESEMDSETPQGSYTKALKQSLDEPKPAEGET